MAWRNILLLVFKMILLPQSSQTVRVNKFGLSDGVVPEKSSTITMKCDVTVSASDGFQALNILKGTTEVAVCYFTVNPTCGVQPGTPARYSVTYTQPSVIITITNLQISDDGEWYCGFQTTGNTSYTLPVYASPVSIIGVGSTDGGDLQLEQVSLSYSTSNCVFPTVKVFQWFYKKGTAQWLLYQNSTPASSQTGCSGSERKYSYTLQLPRYTVWPLQPSNIETTVKFKCRLDFPTLQLPLESNVSGDVKYAVRVTSVTLKDGTKTPSNSDTVEVISGETKTLTCVTGTSRPVATIMWYIGLDVKQRSTSTEYIYSPKYEDNNKQIYCKAFNIQTEGNAVSSNTPKLNVRVKVSTVTLFDGNNTPQDDDVIEVTENQEKTLTCRTGDSNPPSIIMWVINGQLKQNGTNVNFKFTPTNNDHDKMIQCKAYNTQPPNEAVVSFSPKLFVKVLASIPVLTNWTSTIPEFYSGQEVTLSCRSTPTRPAVTVTWKKDGRALTNVQNTVSTAQTTGLMTITSVVTFTPQKSDNDKIVSCETYITDQSPQKSENSLSVWRPPTTPSIPMNSFPWLEGQQQKQLTCSSNDYGNPHADVQWTSSVGTPASDKLNFQQLTRDYNGRNVTCQLINKYTQKMNERIISQVIQLNILYKPDVFIHIGNVEQHSVVKNEGQTLTAICSANGNPTPTASWQGRSPRSTKLEFTDIDRQNHGVYMCTAQTQSSSYPSYNFFNETALDVTVDYAPDVTVNLSTSDLTENLPLVINCIAVGRPNSYNYISMVQTWNGIEIPNSHRPVKGKIEISKLQLEDSGTYTCKVNNGIPDRNQQVDQFGMNSFKVKVSPKVLLEERNTFAGALGMTANITIPFYSYPDVHSVLFTHGNGTAITNSSKYKVAYWKNNVTYRFYEKQVELEGYIAVLQIKVETVSDFGNYTLALQNNVGQQKEWIFKHVSESVPLPPTDLLKTWSEKGVPSFSFVSGFNGGNIQTFIIETTVFGTDNWIEQKRFNESDKVYLPEVKETYHFNLSGLPPNIYNVRILAENTIGRIEQGLAPTLKFEITSDGTTSPKSQVAAIAAGSCSALIVIAIVGGVAFFVRRRKSQNKDGSSTALSRQKPTDEDSSDDEVMTENLAYVSADDVEKRRKMSPGPENLYAQPQKGNKKATSDTGDLYSSVTKSKPEDLKKQKQQKSIDDRKGKNKKQKTKSEDVYENASELTPVTNKALDGNIYENPEETTTRKKKNVNKDGLIYADLTFNDKPKGQKKLVIHGLDSMTEYVEVDFTKKAEPLPDSDEETSQK